MQQNKKELEYSFRSDVNNVTTSSAATTTNKESPTSSSPTSNNNNASMSMSAQIQQQQADASPISTQLNKILKKTKKDTEKKMLLNDEDFN